VGIISIESARAHIRENSDVPDDVIQPYVDGAEAAAAAYLNRAVYADAASLKLAQDDAPEAIRVASAAYGEAVASAAEIEDSHERAVVLDLALRRLDDARVSARRVVHGMVATPDVIAAMKLTLGSLYSNRESVVVGATAVELPEGARVLLRQHRRVQMP